MPRPPPRQIVALGNLLPESADVDELDSYMYQTAGHQLVEAYAQCTGLPLFRKSILGSSRSQVRLRRGARWHSICSSPGPHPEQLSAPVPPAHRQPQAAYLHADLHASQPRPLLCA